MSGRMSTNTGTAPRSTNAFAVETNVNDGMITSSPGPIADQHRGHLQRAGAGMREQGARSPGLRSSHSQQRREKGRHRTGGRSRSPRASPCTRAPLPSPGEGGCTYGAVSGPRATGAGRPAGSLQSVPDEGAAPRQHRAEERRTRRALRYSASRIIGVVPSAVRRCAMRERGQKQEHEGVDRTISNPAFDLRLDDRCRVQRRRWLRTRPAAAHSQRCCGTVTTRIPPPGPSGGSD